MNTVSILKSVSIDKWKDIKEFTSWSFGCQRMKDTYCRDLYIPLRSIVEKA